MTTNSNAGSSPVDRNVMPHTPGPWRIGTAGSTCGVNYSMLGRKRGGWVNILHGNEKHGTETRATPEEAYANARLMRAAPELLAAAQKALDECCDLVATDAGNALAAAIAYAMGHNGEVRGASVTAQPACEASASTVVLEPTAKDE